LEEEVERREMLPETQAGFKRGKSTMNNIFILSHLAQRGGETEGKERKVFALFADLKAAFDNVDRELLWRTLRGQGIEERMVNRLERIYDKTEVLVRTNEGCRSASRRRKA